MADFFWSFWFFSLLGWLLERIFAALTRSPFQRRRCLLLEPLCPVYGLGLTAVLTLPPPLLSGWRLYLSGTVVTTAVEYAYHWWGETFLGVRFWDYTGLPGNLRGRVCLPFSLSWGLLTVPAVTRVAAVPGCLSGDAAGGGAGGPCSHRCDVVAAVGLYRRRGVLTVFSLPHP